MDVANGFNIFQGVGPNYLGGLMDSEARIAIHWAHRLGAIAVTIGVIWLSLRLRTTNAMLSNLLLVLLAIQVTLGILNVVWALPLAVGKSAHANAS